MHTCIEFLCEDIAYYRNYGDLIPIYCRKHKKEKMIHHSMSCQINDLGVYCPTNGSYISNTRMRYCAFHRKLLFKMAERKETDSKPDSKSDSKPDTKPDSKPDSKPDTNYDSESSYISIFLEPKKVPSMRHLRKKEKLATNDQDVIVKKQRINLNGDSKKTTVQTTNKKTQVKIRKKKRRSILSTYIMSTKKISNTKYNDIIELYRIHFKLSEQKSNNKVIKTIIEFVSDKIKELEKYNPSENHIGMLLPKEKLAKFFGTSMSSYYIRSIKTIENVKCDKINLLYRIYFKLSKQQEQNEVIKVLIEFINDKIEELEQQQKSLKRKRT